MEFLSMSRDDVRLHVSSSSSPSVDKVTVGAAILRHGTSGPSILLLKRNPDEKYYPNVFEIPGGKVDATDPTVRDAIIREVAEETQMTVLDVAASLSRIIYTTEKLVKSPTGECEIIKRRALQLNYVVTVEGTDFQVNEEEHSVGIWASRDSLDQIPITSEMGALVSEVLGLEEGRSAVAGHASGVIGCTR
ncbi:MutT family protein [Colletotrichum higginsianum IMI 349063]|uniref:MutT family protein n=1 Tax=Colletotrichum higginsianum (strain IMI 349063) TaxID=759273 RepID=A0A1B7YGB8_COLHI|nr:MutT family protein [Colletotrichum higginsianum IMI 349063]OBR11211.1 MutT family protein [Colletotrichum higginsianum IMI 349063]